MLSSISEQIRIKILVFVRIEGKGKMKENIKYEVKTNLSNHCKKSITFRQYGKKPSN